MKMEIEIAKMTKRSSELDRHRSKEVLFRLKATLNANIAPEKDARKVPKSAGVPDIGLSNLPKGKVAHIAATISHNTKSWL